MKVRPVLLGMVDNTGLVHLNLRRNPTVRTEPYAVAPAVQGRPTARRGQSVLLAGSRAVLTRRLVLARRAVLAGRQNAVVVQPEVVFAAVEIARREVWRRSATAAAVGCLTPRSRYDSPSYLDPSEK